MINASSVTPNWAIEEDENAEDRTNPRHGISGDGVAWISLERHYSLINKGYSILLRGTSSFFVQKMSTGSKYLQSPLSEHHQFPIEFFPFGFFSWLR